MKRKYKMILKNGKLSCKAQTLPYKWTLERVEQLLNDMIEWMKAPDNLFPKEYLVKRGLYPGLIADKIRRWERMNEEDRPNLTEIYRLYSIVKATSEMKVLKGGLTKKYDPTITKLALSHHHGYGNHLEQGATGSIVFQQNILNAEVNKTKSDVEIIRNYQSLVRGLSSSESSQVQEPTEIRADIA